MISIDCDGVRKFFISKFNKDVYEFKHAIQNKIINSKDNDEKSLELAIMFQAYITKQVSNIDDAMIRYNNFVNYALSKVCKQIKQLKQANKEMQQTINNLMANSDSNQN